MSATLIGVLGIVLLLVLLFCGMNIGFSMIVVGFVGYLVLSGTNAAMGIFATVPFTTVANFGLSVIPMFVLMGQFAFYAGISQDLYTACNHLFGRVRGSLATATVVACAFFAAICGSATATTATMGVVCLPEMRKYKYEDKLSTGVIAAGGTLGILIPPSTGFILYGVSASQSIGEMFAAGIVPGIMLALIYIMTIAIEVKLNPALAPKTSNKYTAKEKLMAGLKALPIIVIFVIVLGGIFGGYFAPNGGAAIGAFLAFIFMLCKKKATWTNIKKSCYDTIRTSCMIFLIMIGAYIFGYFLTASKLPVVLASSIAAANMPNIVVILLILLIYAVLGCFIDSLPLIVLLTPIFLPIIQSMGLNEVWFGVLMVMVMQLGLITPPVGMCVYVMAGVAKDVPLMKIFKGVFPFVIALLVAVVIIALIPQITLWLPSLWY